MKSKKFERDRKIFDLMELFLERWKAFQEKAYPKRRGSLFPNIRLAIYAIINRL